MRVKRKDGREEDFVVERIVVSVVKSGGNVGLARQIAKEVESVLAANELVTTEQIRTEVLNRLKTMDAATYNSWIAYDKENKK